MGRLIKDTVVSAHQVISASSPVLTEANSQLQQTIYVAANGNDANDGLSLATPFLTIKAAMAKAATITTSNPGSGLPGQYSVSVRVSSGLYIENNPVVIPQNVALMGDNNRTVFITPYNLNNDVFLVEPGCYVWGVTLLNYASNGFSFAPDASPGYVSPYIQNVTSKATDANATCVLIDGSVGNAASTKAIILGFITVINQGGTGLKLVNRAYSQTVNFYTLFCNVSVKVESGSFISLVSSDSGVGNYGIWADGLVQLFTGNVVGNVQAGNTTITLANVASNIAAVSPHTNNGILIGSDPQMYYISNYNHISGNTWQANITGRFANSYSSTTALAGYAVSTVSASGHTMEYVGSGTVSPNALPQNGGIPNPANEVVQTNYGKVNYTSTDQYGNFNIGPNLSIISATGTIEGDDFDRSLFAVLTPYILSIEG